MGLPAMNITFVARAQNSAKRLDRGFVGMVLKDAKVPSGNPVTIFSSEDIPEELGTDNKNQIALALRGNDTAPQKVTFLVACIVAIWIICNEIISILENIKDMGVIIPAFLIPLVTHVKSQVEDKVNIDTEKEDSEGE